MTSTDNDAFRNCRFTGRLTIPASIEKIGDRAFRECGGTGFDVDDANTAYKDVDNVLMTKDGKTLIACPTGAVGELKIPAGVEIIGYTAFSGCTLLTGELTIPEGVKTIGYNAFGHCSGLKGTLTIPSTAEKIESAAFNYCTGITGTIKIPKSVSSIEPMTFWHCGGSAFDVDEANTIYKDVNGLLMTKNGKTLIACPIDMTGTLTIPEGVEVISSGALLACDELTGTLTIPSSVRTIERFAFSDCSGLTGTLTIPEGVEYIGEYAFSSCSGFDGTIKIPKSISTIDARAFSGCGGSAFDVDDANTIYKDVNGFLMTKDGKTFMACPVDMAGTLTIPEGVEVISKGAFFLCESFTGGLSIPDTVKTIDDGAFFYCRGFTSISIPSSVSTIGYGVFSGISFYSADGKTLLDQSVGNLAGHSFSGTYDKMVMKSGGSSDNTVLIVVCVIAVIAILCGVGYYFFKKR